MRPCSRCQTYCYGDCTSDVGGPDHFARTNGFAPGVGYGRRATRTVTTAEPKITIGGVPKTRADWLRRIAEDEARLSRITDASAREITEQAIAKIRAAL